MRSRIWRLATTHEGIAKPASGSHTSGGGYLANRRTWRGRNPEGSRYPRGVRSTADARMLEGWGRGPEVGDPRDTGDHVNMS